MTVIVLIAVAPGSRGHLTRWMVEVDAEVFVGKPSRRALILWPSGRISDNSRIAEPAMGSRIRGVLGEGDAREGIIGVAGLGSWLRRSR